LGVTRGAAPRAFSRHRLKTWDRCRTQQSQETAVVTLKKNLAGSGVIAALLLCGATAQAVPVIYDFTGTGTVCTYTSTGACINSHNGGFTGTISIDVLTNDPSSLGSYGTDGSTNAYAINGWVESDFLIQWAGNSFNPGPIEGQTHRDQFARVYNSPGYAPQSRKL